nr:MAG TPA: antirepressor protein [Caudoviricetes sp.]
MDELITVNFDTQTVSARELHEKLNIEKRFSAWFETNSKGFVEGEDFTSVLSGTVVNNGAQRELQDYAVSVDMAKHICLMSRTEVGKRCRQYLIDLEKAWNTPEQIFARALKLADQTISRLKDRCEFLGGQVVEQQKIIDELEPKASYYDLILQCRDLISTTVIAKDYGMSAKKFNLLLHNLGIQFKQGNMWVLYAKYQGCGYLKTKTHNYPDAEGVQHSKEHSYWTQKGRLFIYEFLKQKDILPLIEIDHAA